MSKIVKKNKGTVSHYDDDSFEFSPYGKGEPVYDHSYKVGVSTLGLTKGAGKQNYIAHLKCKADEPDPLGALQDQLTKLETKSQDITNRKTHNISKDSRFAGQQYGNNYLHYSFRVRVVGWAHHEPMAS